MLPTMIDITRPALSVHTFKAEPKPSPAPKTPYSNTPTSNVNNIQPAVTSQPPLPQTQSPTSHRYSSVVTYPLTLLVDLSL